MQILEMSALLAYVCWRWAPCRVASAGGTGLENGAPFVYFAPGATRPELPCAMSFDEPSMLGMLEYTPQPPRQFSYWVGSEMSTTAPAPVSFSVGWTTLSAGLCEFAA